MKSIYITILICFCHCLTSYSQCYNLVWSDDFTGSTLDNTKWSHEIGASGWGNNELQYYTDRVDNSYVSGGSLKIEAKNESYLGANYTSARIRTKNKGDWTYGKMEASIKLPVGQGIWPAFWMLPTDNVYGGWPVSGEIDIMEYLGHQTSTIYGTCHYGNNYLDKSSSGNSNNISPATYADGAFHTFTIEWEPTQIRWFVDGTQYHTFNASDVGAYTFPFGEDFHFIINVAVGGNWPGNPDGTTVFPQILELDYIRVYQELDDIKIKGDDILEPNETGISYSVPDLPSTTYTWSVPNGASIASGVGTHEILVDWATTAGDIEVIITNACGTTTKTLPIVLSANLSLNPGFEFDFQHWDTDLFNGASATWNISTSDVHSGAKSMCTTVNSIATAAWNIQISPTTVDLVNGEEYTIYFWAKADAINRQMSIAMIDASNFAYFTGETYTLTDTWALYSHTYTSTVNTTSSINVQFGHETGVFCLDDFVFARTVNLPVELIDFYGNCKGNDIELNWSTASETEFSHFEIERSINEQNEFNPIGQITGSNTSELQNYTFTDNSPATRNYYRLKQVDLDGSYEYSKVIILNSKKKQSKLYPSVSSNWIIIEGLNFNDLISIYNTNGQLVHSENVIGERTMIDIKIQELSQGMYFIRVGDEVLQFVKK